jgi:hypothetical protein
LRQTQTARPHTLVFPHRNAVCFMMLIRHVSILHGRLLPTWLVFRCQRSPRHNSLKKRLTSRSFLRVARRSCLLSRVQRPCLKLPLRAPDGPPEPFAPPCIRQRARPLTAACRQGRPVRVLAPQRGALAHIGEPALDVGLTHGVVCQFLPATSRSSAALTMPTIPLAPECIWTCRTSTVCL